MAVSSWRAVPRPLAAHDPWRRGDAALLLALTAVTLGTRVALRTRGTFSVDSMLLALGVRSYDFAAYHPHPPYYALVVAAAKLLAPWTGAMDALTWLSVASSVVLVGCVFAVARALAGRWAGAWAGALAVLSPLALSNGVLPLSYASEGAASALVAALALEARRSPRPASWAALAVAASIAVGLRPSAALTAGPLVAWALLSPQWRQWRPWAWTFGAGAAASLAWLLPAIAAGGTWSTFRYGLSYQSRLFILSNPVWAGGSDAVRNNVAWLRHHLQAELATLAAAALLAALTALWPSRRRTPAGFLAVWILPSLLFYGLVYAGWPIFPSGYVMGLLPALLVACAVVLRRLADLARDALLDAGPRLVALATVAGLAAAPAAWVTQWDDALEMRDRTQAFEASLDGLEEAFPADSTAVVASYLGPWMVLEHPGHLTWIIEAAATGDGEVRLQLEETRHGRSDKRFFDNLRDGSDDPAHPVPPWVRRIVLLQGHPMEGDVPPLLDRPPDEVVRLRGGAQVAVYDAADIATVESVIAQWGTVGSSSPPAGLIWPPT